MAYWREREPRGAGAWLQLGGGILAKTCCEGKTG
jgi:hypothetical protein